MILRTLSYVCDKCHKVHSLLDAEDALDIPTGWKSQKITYSFSYGYAEKHYCETCVEKEEIRETFK